MARSHHSPNRFTTALTDVRRLRGAAGEPFLFDCGGCFLQRPKLVGVSLSSPDVFAKLNLKGSNFKKRVEGLRMSNGDKIQKQMEFIVDQQAQFASDLGQLRDIVARLANASLKRIENLEEKASALVDAQIKSEGKISALAEAQTHTDERLNTFITVVERYISRDQNRNAQG